LAETLGVPLATAAGTVIVDVTVGVFIQAGFTVLGLVLLVYATGQTSFVRPTLFGTLIALLAFSGFYFAQRKGMFRFLGRIISRLASSPDWQSLVQHGDTLDQTIQSLYRIISLVVASGEVWIALFALDLPAPFIHAFILQTMAYTIRSAAFAVPGGLGVQEGGYLIVGNLLGIPGESAFALSLIARVRELGLGIPGLIVWQLVEGRRLFRGRALETDR
jgi:putative membrane protein